MKELLEINHLSVSFQTEEGEVQAIRDVSFRLEKGETLAILGESGCGKSVLCKSILRILPENAWLKAGSISLAGMNLHQCSETEMSGVRGKEIAMIFQDPMTSLNPTISIGKQIMEAVLLHQKVTKIEAKRKTIELMELVGIDQAEKRFDQYPYHFSGGMRQRSVIAIALAGNPKVLVADEPTTALDVTIQAQILELLKELQQTRDLTILFITHDLGVVADIADRIAIMYAGKIVEIGTSREIFYDPRHPYTWGLLSSLPMLEEKEVSLQAIPGMPPNLLHPPLGDAFASRNRYALKIDYEQEPPLFSISETHQAATWLLHEQAPIIKAPITVQKGKVIRHER